MVGLEFVDAELVGPVGVDVSGEDSGVVDLGVLYVFFFQAEDGIRAFCLSRGLGGVYERQD